MNRKQTLQTWLKLVLSVVTPAFIFNFSCLFYNAQVHFNLIKTAEVITQQCLFYVTGINYTVGEEFGQQLLIA